MSERVIDEKEIEAFLTGLVRTLPESELFCRVMAEASLYIEKSWWTKAGENFGWALANYDIHPTNGKYYPVLTRESILALARGTGSVNSKKKLYKDYDLSWEDGEPLVLGKIWFQELLARILLPSD